MIHFAESKDFQKWVKAQPFRFGQAYIEKDEVDDILTGGLLYKNLSKANKKKVYLPFGLNDVHAFFLTKVASVFHYQTHSKCKVKLVLKDKTEIITQGKSTVSAYGQAMQELMEKGIVS